MKNKERPSQNLTYVFVTVLLALALLIFADYLGYTEKLQAFFVGENNNCVRFLDVGQADCTLFENEGKFFLIDVGNNTDDGFAVESKLRHYGVDTLDGIILSHLHSDHAGGINRILENFDCKSIYLSSSIDREDESYLDLFASLSDETKVIYLNRNDKIFFGSAVFSVLWTSERQSGNNSSLVIKAECDEMCFFFGGDISSTVEREMLNAGVLSRFDVLKASHHGSKSSSCDEFLDYISPKYCVCFCGEDNRFEFPNEEFVNRLRQRDITLYVTCENGDITFDTAKQKVILEKTNAAHQ